MANHCIEVVCVGCGRHWCLRYCNFHYGPNPEVAERSQARLAAGVKPYVYKDETCCKGFPVVDDSILAGS